MQYIFTAISLVFRTFVHFWWSYYPTNIYCCDIWPTNYKYNYRTVTKAHLTILLTRQPWPVRMCARGDTQLSKREFRYSQLLLLMIHPCQNLSKGVVLAGVKWCSPRVSLEEELHKFKIKITLIKNFAIYQLHESSIPIINARQNKNNRS